MEKSPILLSFIMLFLLTGCWSKIEINERAFVTGIFIDQTNKPDEVEVTIATPLTNRLNIGQQTQLREGKAYGSVSKKGRTIAEALHKIQSDTTRKLTWGHTRIVVIGHEYAKKGLKPFLEWATRQPSFILKTYILIAPNQAKQISRLTPVYEDRVAEVLREFANQEMVLSTSIREIIMGLIDNQGSAVTILTFGEVPMVSEEEKENPWAGTNGAALFQNDKMVGKINAQEAMMFAWIRGRLKNSTFILPLGSKKEKISIGFEQLKSKIRPSLHGKRIKYDFLLEGNAYIISADTEQNISQAESTHQIEQELKKLLTKHLKQALYKTQKAKADALQLGSRLEWWYPKKWAEVRHKWQDTYQKNVDFHIQIKTHLHNFGSEYDPLKVETK